MRFTEKRTTHKTAINLINQIRPDNQLFLWLRRCFFVSCLLWWLLWIYSRSYVELIVKQWLISAHNILKTEQLKRPIIVINSAASSPTYRHKLQFRSTAIWRCRNGWLYNAILFFFACLEVISAHFRCFGPLRQPKITVMARWGTVERCAGMRRHNLTCQLQASCLQLIVYLKFRRSRKSTHDLLRKVRQNGQIQVASA